MLIYLLFESDFFNKIKLIFLNKIEISTYISMTFDALLFNNTQIHIIYFY